MPEMPGGSRFLLIVATNGNCCSACVIARGKDPKRFLEYHKGSVRMSGHSSNKGIERKAVLFSYLTNINSRSPSAHG